MARQTVMDCVVVGAGPAGLAASAALSADGIEHVVLERGRPGESWRTQRWDSFRLNTPGWMNRLLGEQARDAYLTGAEVAQRLEKLAADRPVRFGARVERLAPDGDGYALDTGDGTMRARTVIVASGDQNLPRVPRLARALPGRVAQYHTADYREPGGLPPGGVLVVGSAQSGCQIAEDLLAVERRVVLATGPVGRVPWRHRGRDTFEWLVDAGFFDQRPQDLPDRSVMGDPQPIVASGGRSLSLQALARAGATLAGRLVAVTGERVGFDGSAAANLAAGDAFAARIRAMVDNLIDRHGLPLPPFEADPTDAPVALDPPATLDLRAEEIGSVIWCTGFGGDFSYLDPALLDADGQPRRRDAAGAAPGLWYLGLKWLTHRRSGILFGFPDDAAAVADAVRARL
ncbi:MAG TPA: NAD(P)-binding domain-containing protein [Actinomycetota bacterium]|jgi:putative flavoprotein involved in K+ transport|nr:NAD(P)-binding domain-containing protein [Actinomycetota bacterium]